MKHIVRLTESDIRSLVKNVIHEIIEDGEKYDEIFNNYEPFEDDEEENEE